MDISGNLTLCDVHLVRYGQRLALGFDCRAFAGFGRVLCLLCVNRLLAAFWRFNKCLCGGHAEVVREIMPHVNRVLRFF